MIYSILPFGGIMVMVGVFVLLLWFAELTFQWLSQLYNELSGMALIQLST